MKLMTHPKWCIDKQKIINHRFNDIFLEYIYNKYEMKRKDGSNAYYKCSLFGIVFPISCVFSIKDKEGADCTLNIHDFISVLNAVIDERFPNTNIYIVRGGDFIKDIVLELREEDKKLRYSPYELFCKSEDYEDTIEKLAEQWQSRICF